MTCEDPFGECVCVCVLGGGGGGQCGYTSLNVKWIMIVPIPEFKCTSEKNLQGFLKFNRCKLDRPLAYSIVANRIGL